jgi:hypothetical protein
MIFREEEQVLVGLSLPSLQQNTSEVLQVLQRAVPRTPFAPVPGPPLRSASPCPPASGARRVSLGATAQYRLIAAPLTCPLFHRGLAARKDWPYW